MGSVNWGCVDKSQQHLLRDGDVTAPKKQSIATGRVERKLNIFQVIRLSA